MTTYDKENNKFKLAREKHNLGQEKENRYTQKDIAAMINVHESVISHLERGEVKNPTEDQINIYCKLFGVTPSFLVGDNLPIILKKNLHDIEDLGLSISSLDTILRLRNSNTFHSMDTFNALISNGKDTEDFLKNLIDYLYRSTDPLDKAQYDSLISKQFLDYINTFVRPQLKDVIDEAENFKIYDDF